MQGLATVQPNIVLNELWELMSYTTPKSNVVACAVGKPSATSAVVTIIAPMAIRPLAKRDPSTRSDFGETVATVAFAVRVTIPRKKLFNF